MGCVCSCLCPRENLLRDELEAENRYEGSTSSWMGKLSEVLRNKPLYQLAIPGTHDSGTFNLDMAEFGPGPLENLAPLLGHTCGVGNKIAKNWSAAQNQSFREQLDSGVRYFDLRVAFCPSTRQFRFVHGFYGNEVRQELQEIKQFLNEHNTEVVILDFNHFYQMEDFHEAFKTLVNQVFSDLACDHVANMDTLTLTYMRTLEPPRQVIIIYDDKSEGANVTEAWLWQGTLCIESPWPKTTNTDTLKSKLNELNTRRNDCFYVSQGLLTPDTCYILRNLCGSIEENCGKKAFQTLLNWLDAQRIDNENGLNIVISDFTSLHNNIIIRRVISKNFI